MERLSYISSTDDVSGQYTTIPDLLEKRAEVDANKEMFIFYKDGNRFSITCAELYDQCLKFANVLDTLGVKKSDAVIVEVKTSKEWLIIHYSLMITGAIPLGTFAARDDASDLEYVVSKSEAVAIFTDNTNLKALSTIHNLVHSSEHPYLTLAVGVNTPENMPDLHSFWKLLDAEHSRFDRSSVYLDPDDPAMIVQSSGTTGNPKLVTHSHRSFLREMIVYKRYVDIDVDVKFITNCTFTWALGSTTSQLVSGWKRVTNLGGLNEKPEVLLECAEKEGCQVALFTSDLTQKIINQLDGKLPSCIQVLYFGGSPFKRQLGKVCGQLKYLVNMYGSTEMGIISGEKMHNGHLNLEDNMAGYPAPGLEIKITDREHRLVERGTYGRIYTRHQYRFLDYYNDRNATRHILSSADWYDTQDVGHISTEGKLFVVGRCQDEITRGAVIIHPSGVEKTVKEMKLSFIRDVIAIPVPDDIYGQEMCLCVIKEPGNSLTEDELKIIISQRIALEQFRPRYIAFFESFPVNANGKISRKDLMKHAIQILGLN